MSVVQGSRSSCSGEETETSMECIAIVVACVSVTQAFQMRHLVRSGG